MLLLKEPIIGTEYDAILVVIDRLTKYAYFIPYLKVSTAEELAYIFLKYIISNYKLLKKIILDRDKLFILKFYKFLTI